MTDESSLPASSRVLVEMKDVQKTFSTQHGQLVACADISLSVVKGRSLGVVGESGSGKSTLMRVMQLLEPATRGEIWMRGANVTKLPRRRLKPYLRHVQFVAQDPYGSLFPHFTIGKNIEEPLRLHGEAKGLEARRRAVELMDLVGIPRGYYYQYPHELSGGQQQRVAIARALALSPDLLILDEAVSSLDVSIQAQILNLLQKMKTDLGVTYAFISHNLAVIRLLCDVTAVMYLGRIVEYGDSDSIFQRPLHPYTKALLQSIPAFTEDGVTPLPERPMAAGVRPSPTNLPLGCAYHTRCPFATDECRSERPVLRKVGEREVACHYAERMS